MKIVANTGQPVERPPAAAPAAAPQRAAAAGVETADQVSAVVGPAQAALAALPEIDEAKVEALRDALARGEIHFDAERLAGLIQRFHGAGR